LAGFLVLGGPALLVSFGLSLVFPGRILALIGVAGLIAAIVWGVVADSSREIPWSFVVALWSMAWLVGLAFAGIARAFGWLTGIGVRDK
jgi:hypothetical protein